MAAVRIFFFFVVPITFHEHKIPHMLQDVHDNPKWCSDKLTYLNILLYHASKMEVRIQLFNIHTYIHIGYNNFIFNVYKCIYIHTHLLILFYFTGSIACYKAYDYSTNTSKIWVINCVEHFQVATVSLQIF